MSIENRIIQNNVKMVGEHNIKVQKRNFSSESCSVTTYCGIDSCHCTKWSFLILGDKA